MVCDAESVNARTVVFLHIPKSGGTSLRGVITRQFRGHTAFRFDGSEGERRHFRDLPQEARDQFALVEGHLYYGVHRMLSRPAAYITMLREPVDRVLSFYYFVLRVSTHYLHGYFKAGRDLREAIERSGNPELDNFQVRLLAGEASLNVRKGAVTREMLERAKANLRQFAVVGLTDRFDEALALLGVRFGWRDLTYDWHKRTDRRPRVADCDASLIELIRASNALDVELYEFAQGLIDQSIERERAAVASMLEGLRARQAMHEVLDPPSVEEPSLVGGVWRL